MLATSASLRNILFLLIAFLFAIAILFRIMNAVRMIMVHRFIARAARPQVVAFRMMLGDLVFRDPVTFMGRLWADDAAAFVRQLWKEAAAKVARADAAEIPDAGMDVSRLHLDDGRPMAVITMPRPENIGEPYFIGVVLPADKSLSADMERARQAVRYFFLNRWEGGRDTDLCESTGKRLLTFNIGSRRTPEAFAAAVGAKLQELGR